MLNDRRTTSLAIWHPNNRSNNPGGKAWFFHERFAAWITGNKKKPYIHTRSATFFSSFWIFFEAFTLLKLQASPLVWATCLGMISTLRCPKKHHLQRSFFFINFPTHNPPSPPPKQKIGCWIFWFPLPQYAILVELGLCFSAQLGPGSWRLDSGSILFY